MQYSRDGECRRLIYTNFNLLYHTESEKLILYFRKYKILVKLYFQEYNLVKFSIENQITKVEFRCENQQLSHQVQEKHYSNL